MMYGLLFGFRPPFTLRFIQHDVAVWTWPDIHSGRLKLQWRCQRRRCTWNNFGARCWILIDFHLALKWKYNALKMLLIKNVFIFHWSLFKLLHYRNVTEKGQQLKNRVQINVFPRARYGQCHQHINGYTGVINKDYNKKNRMWCVDTSVLPHIKLMGWIHLHNRTFPAHIQRFAPMHSTTIIPYSNH